MTAFDSIARAARPEDLFGNVADVADLKRQYHLLARKVHPDQAAGCPDDAFKRLGELFDEAERRLAAGIYGTRAPTPKPKTGPTVIERRGRCYVVGDLVASGDICDVFRASYLDAGAEVSCALKVCREGVNNDLVANETAVLKALGDPALPAGKRYATRLLDAFRLPDSARGPRQVAVLKWLADCYTLEEVRAAYPGGVCLEDAVWFFNRMLEGLGYIHRGGYIHGAVLPQHFAIRPRDHGGKFLDFSYAVPAGERVRALSVPWRAIYAPEIPNKQPVSPSTDIYMAAQCIAYVLGGSADVVPTPRPGDPTKHRAAQQFAAFLRTCLAERPGARVDDAWAVRKSLDEMMRRLYGPPKFHPFSMPRDAK